MNLLLLPLPAAPSRTAAIRLGIAAAVLAIIAPTQNWVLAQPTLRPAPLHRHSMVFDAAHGVVLLFGGHDPIWPLSDDTWTWNGADWLHLQPATRPPGRDGAGMVYDSTRNRAVLFGGHGSSGSWHSDTWEWDGLDWLQRTPVHAPAGRYVLAMAYDAARARTVLFGGAAGGIARFDDTWTWDGTDWTQLAPVHSPGMRVEAGMAYDTARARCVLFGGDLNTPLDETWTWDGIDWAQQATAHAPSPRTSPVLTYDTANQRIVLYGGENDQDVYDDTWEYDGNDWVALVPLTTPGERRGTALAYDASRAQVVLFGGLPPSANPTIVDDTWLFEHDPGAATFTPFGHGCQGTIGVPQLGLASGLPVIGTTFQVACTNLQLDHFTTMWIGFSHTAWLGHNLPYDLALFGMPGCTLFVSSDLVTLLLNWHGTAMWQMGIPNAPQIIGLSFYMQAGVIDRVNALGMVVTNAAAVSIGDH